ncbi:MAG: type IV secretory system conjugative DNA transfer family protein, partial [Sciscionella sp.]
TLYLLSQRAEAVGVAGLLAALLDEIVVFAREHAQRQPNNRLDPACRLLADEAPNTTTLRSLPDLISDGGGRGLPTTMVVQDRAQAVSRWGRDDAASMWGAATIRVVLPGVAGSEELREIASYAGDYDEETHTLTRGGGQRSEQSSLRTLPALQPADVRAIPPHHALLIAAGGLRPVMTRLTPYYQRPDAALSAESEQRFYTALADGRTVP